MARAALRMSVRDLAEAAHVSPNTVTRVEAEQPVNTSTLIAIRQAMEAAGAEFRQDGSVRQTITVVEDPEGTN